jgi:hypothetical protein
LQPPTDKVYKELFADSQSITPSDIPALECRPFNDITVHAFAETRMFYAIIPDGAWLLTAACIDGRTIPLKLLRPVAVPAGYSAIFLFESDVFAGKSDSARQRLVLSDDVDPVALERACRRQIGRALREKIPEINKRNASTMQDLDTRYPHLVGLQEDEPVGLLDRDEAVDNAQRVFFKRQREVIDGNASDDATFAKSLEVASRSLTAYVLYREWAINRLRAIRREDREDAIHNMIAPQRHRVDSIQLVDEIHRTNVWLLDDKFMSFRTILSEKTMDDVIEAIAGERPGNDKRPDIALIFDGDPDTEKVSVVVVELKKRDADEKENHNVHTQLINRARVLVNYWPNIQRVWYFGIIDIDSDLEVMLGIYKWLPLFSKGKSFYQEFTVPRADGTLVPTPITLVSYDTIIEDAAVRNQAFLEVLRNAFRKAKARGA